MSFTFFFRTKPQKEMRPFELKTEQVLARIYYPYKRGQIRNFGNFGVRFACTFYKLWSNALKKGTILKGSYISSIIFSIMNYLIALSNPYTQWHSLTSKSNHVFFPFFAPTFKKRKPFPVPGLNSLKFLNRFCLGYLFDFFWRLAFNKCRNQKNKGI